MAYVGQAGQYRPADDGSSSAVSSPPRSPENPTPPNFNVQMHQRDKALGVFANAPATSQPSQMQGATNALPNPNLTAKGLPRKKPGRKPKDPNAPPAQPAKPRKRVKTSDAGAAAAETATAPAPGAGPAPVPVVAAAPKQSKITDLVGAIQVAPHQPIHQSPPAPTATSMALGGHARDGVPSHSTPTLGHSIAPSVPATPRPASSGQIFDPVRGSTVPVESSHHATPPHPPVSPNHQSQIVNRASASPSIKSLIDPTPPIPQAQPRLAPPQSVTSAPVSPAPVYRSHPNANPFTGPAGSNVLSATQSVPAPTHHTPMDLDGPSTLSAIKKPDAPSTAPSSSAPTPPAHQPKAPRAKEAPPPMPTGSGLLSATPFGPGSATNGNGGDPEASTSANIYLTFALKGKQNTTINFAREVERKYGFAALHPRLAARKERQRLLAAAGAALEREIGGAAGVGASGDDMSLDALSDGASDDEGKGGATAGAGDDTAGSGGGTGADAPVKKRRRRRMEEYDRTDDFIDDTEMLWEESALMAKDGFFVYSGPLVVEGAKMDVERSDGTVSKRGRGRGRGGSSRGDAAARGSRGGGRGSRGGATVRKPRVTKADRALMEQEKLEREKMAATLAAKPPAVGQPPLSFPLGGVAS